MSKLQGKEFIEEGFFNDYVKGINEALELTKNLKSELKKGVSSSFKEVKIITPESLKDIEKFNESVNNTNKKLTDLEKIEKKQIALRNELKRLNTDEQYKKEVVELEKLRQEKLAFNKQTRDEIKASRDVQNEYKKQSKLLNDLRNKYKNVALTQGENSKQAKELLKAITPLDEKLKRVDKTVGQNTRNVGNYEKATDKLKGALASLGITLGLVGAVRLFKDTIGIVRNFEKQSATLAGVLGKTREEIIDLDNDAKRLGETTEFTASEVGSLQEAYARLGFTQSQILQTTEATLKGATALQSELGETAELVGSTLNQFGLDASESANIVDVLAKSTQISALNFKQLQTALPIVGKTASVAGVSLEETASLLGVLASNGIDASTSGTGLRNIFLDLSKKGLTFEDALNKINGSQDKLSEATQLFGKRGATVALTLAESTEKTSKFNKELIFAGGTAEKLAETQLKTLDGSLKLLNSAWEGYILKLNDATSGGNILTKGIRFLSENLETVLNVVKNAIIAFTTYKVTVFAVTKSIQAYNLVSNLFQNGIKGVTTAFKGLNKVTKANLIGLFVSAIVTAVSVLKDFAGQLSSSEKAQKRLNEAQKEAEQSISKERAELKLLLDTAQKETLSKQERQKAIDRLNEIVPEYNNNLSIENINTKAVDEATKKYLKTLVSKAKLQALNSKLVDIQNEKIENQTKSLEDQVSTYDKLIIGLKGLNPFRSQSGKFIDQTTEALKRGASNLKENTKSLEDQEAFIIKQIQSLSEYSDEVENSTKKIDKNTESTDKNTKSKKENNKQTRDQIKLETLKSDSIDESNSKIIESTEKTNSVILNLTKSLGEKTQEENNKRLENRKKSFEALNNISDAFAERERERSQERINDIDNEIQASQNRVNALQQIAEAGNLNAQQSLGVEKKRQDEARLEREREVQKQKQIEASLALLKTYTSSLENGATPQVALTEVLKNGTLLAGLINALPSFYEGTENTTRGNLDNKGGFLSVLHPNERVVPEKFNKHLTGIPNSFLPKLAENYKQNLTVDTWQSNNEILEKFDRLESAIKDQKQTNIRYDFDNIESVVTKIIESKNKVTRTHKKISIFD